MHEILYFLLRDRILLFYLIFTAIILLFYYLLSMCCRYGLKKTLFITGTAVLICFTLIFTWKNLRRRYPYDLMVNFEYREMYYYDIFSMGDNFKIKYHYGKLTYIYEEFGQDQEISEIRLSWAEQKELKNILKQYQILEWESHAGTTQKEILSSTKDNFTCMGYLDHFTFWIDNGELPDNYNEFAAALWDFVLEKAEKAGITVLS